MGWLNIMRLLAAALLLALPAASMAEGVLPLHANPALWRVQNGTSTVYLFGSLHILPPGYHWTTPEIESAMNASDLFIFEVPVDEAALMDEKQFIIENGILPSRQSLRGLLSANEFQTYSAVLRRAGLKPEQFERYRPWLAAVVVGLAYLHRDELVTLKGADDDLITYARDHSRKSLYLESIRDQMELLTAGDDSGHLKSLKTLIATLPQARSQERDLLQTWASGEAKRFTALLEGYFKDRPEAKDFLIDRRNRNWLDTLKQSLERQNGTTMITVGAAHIGGENGLIALLCGEGYEVERVAERDEASSKVCGAGT